MPFPKFLRIASLSTENVNDKEGKDLKRLTFLNVDNELIRALSTKLGFSYKLASPQDGEYGRLLANGSWSGLVGMVLNGQADLIINRFSISQERAKVIEFSNPYYIDSLTFSTRLPEYIGSSAAFLKPFSFSVWLAIFVCVMTVTPLYYALCKRNYPHKSIGFSMTNQQSPKSAAEYVLKYCCFITGILLRYFYAAVLLSFLTFPSLSGVRTVAELSVAVEEGKYRCVTTLGSSFTADFMNSNDYTLNVIGRNLNETKGTNNLLGVLSNYSLPFKPAIIAARARLLTLEPDYFVSDDGFFIDGMAIGMKKGFCCKSQLNEFINYFWASGIYNKLLRDATIAGSSTIDEKKVISKSGRPLSTTDMRGALILLLLGYCISTGVFLLELVFHSNILDIGIKCLSRYLPDKYKWREKF